MILFEEAGQSRVIAPDRGQETGRPTPILVVEEVAGETVETASAAGSGDERKAREEVEAWLDAVALCFGLHRRWIDCERF